MSAFAGSGPTYATPPTVVTAGVAVGVVAAGAGAGVVAECVHASAPIAHTNASCFTDVVTEFTVGVGDSMQRDTRTVKES